ncbi:hypothetical protein IMSHALPRED_006802 [Imshaugia aleurites]|uniref:DUF6594 domain-containing protein n=1 Tax=Imshaugia aleurites TaxID=172621 RepID=A0A8H3FJM9_9LECA|nr:hypothetical protein IMSHALPRED_006802 [Imshaugia aleurites]
MEPSSVSMDANLVATSSTIPLDVKILVEQIPVDLWARHAQILRTDSENKLPLQFNSTQVAIARALDIRTHSVENVSRVGHSFFSDGGKRWGKGLKELTALLRYYELQRSLKAMDNGATDANLQDDLLVRVAESLQRYLDAEAACEPQARSSDMVRASVKLLIKPFMNFILAGKFGIDMWLHGRFRTVWSEQIDDEKATLDAVVDVLARQIIAFLGGLCLVIPLIMMTFLTSVGARLAIVCCCVLLFSFFIGIVTKASNQEVLGATAAYTAVLVVFVGTSSSPQS